MKDNSEKTKIGNGVMAYNLNNETIKHLEFIQNTITRMSHCSFMFKGWCITIISAFLALYAEMENPVFLLCAIAPILVFWGLDGYYLQQERIYRELYDLACEGSVNVFILSPTKNIRMMMNKKRIRYFNVLFSQTLLILYLSLILMLFVIYIINLFVR